MTALVTNGAIGIGKPLVYAVHQWLGLIET